MDVIRELQRKLKEAQQNSSVRKISERNCIDLVQKLIQTEQVKLLHTTTGKEWLTPEQLDREIRDVLSASGGRLSITDLPNEIGVAIEHCEVRVELLRKQDPSLIRLHGELLSSTYLQSVADEVEESLEEAGYLAVSDLASRYNLPAEFIRDSVIVLVGNSSSYVVKQNTIFTGAHAARVEARARGAIRACTQPVALSQLASRHGLDEALVTNAVQKLVKADGVLGKLQGSTFTPRAYSEAQASRVSSFFDSNSYMPQSLVKSAGMSLKEWVQSSNASGVTLITAFLASQLAESALASITDAITSDTWIDVQPLLPPALTLEDARELLQQFHHKKQLPAGSVVMDRIVLTQSFLKQVAHSLEGEVKAAAERALAAPAAASSRGAKKAAASQPVDADDDVGPKKKGKRAARSKKGKADDEDDEGAAGAGAAESGIEAQVICDVLTESYPELPADLHYAFSEQVQPLLAAMVEEAQSAMRATLQSKQKAVFEQTEKLVQERYETLVLGLRALDSTQLAESPLQQYLLREAITEPLHRLLAARLEEVTGTCQEVTAANRKQVLDKIIASEGAAKADSLTKLAALFAKGKEGKDAKEAKEERKEAKSSKSSKSKEAKAEKLQAEVEGGDAADPAELYHAAANDCHIFCRKVDKKREKAALQEQRAQLRERLKPLPSTDALKVCHVGLQLALVLDGVAGTVFPPEDWALKLVVQRLANEKLRDEALALCEALAKGSEGDPVALEGTAASWKEHLLEDR